MTFENVGSSEELPKSCASIDTKLDDICKFHSTNLTRLTWIHHPDTSIQKLSFQSTLQLLDFIKAVITELVVGALRDAVCMIMHWMLASQASQASIFLQLVFPRCFNLAAANTPFPIYEEKKKKKDLIQDC